jgi:electron transfer flavoprotein alpha/beta subunit
VNGVVGMGLSHYHGIGVLRNVSKVRIVYSVYSIVYIMCISYVYGIDDGVVGMGLSHYHGIGVLRNVSKVGIVV